MLESPGRRRGSRADVGALGQTSGFPGKHRGSQANVGVSGQTSGPRSDLGVPGQRRVPQLVTNKGGYINK